MRQPDYLTAFAALWDSEDLDDWKRWARWRLIRARAAWLTDELVDADFEFYGRLLSGTEQIRDRWKRAVSLVEGLMGDAVGKLYVAAAFPAGRQGPHRRPGGQPARGVPAQHQRPGLDDAADP